MTAYFDEVHNSIRQVDLQGANAWTEFGQIEEKMVFDVTVCSSFELFPEDLRQQVHLIVLRYAVQCMPVNAPPVDFEEMSTYAERLNRMAWDLHTVFHDLVYRRSEDPDRSLSWFTDDPRSPLRVLFSKGDEVREQMVAAAQEGDAAAAQEGDAAGAQEGDGG